MEICEELAAAEEGDELHLAFHRADGLVETTVTVEVAKYDEPTEENDGEYYPGEVEVHLVDTGELVEGLDGWPEVISEEGDADGMVEIEAEERRPGEWSIPELYVWNPDEEEYENMGFVNYVERV